MRCDKMHATITVERCLANQEKRVGYDCWTLGGVYYPGCKDCETGAAARAGKLDDEDVEELKRKHDAGTKSPPTPLYQRGEQGGIYQKGDTGGIYQREAMDDGKDEPEKQMEETMKKDKPDVVGANGGRPEPERDAPATTEKVETKVCVRCKEAKPLERFTRKSKGSEDRRAHCMDCEREYQRGWSQRRRERFKSLEKGLQAAKLIEDHAAAARQRNGMQAEPTPVKEILAPACLQNEDEILENQLLLDFSYYPEVLKEIKRLAHHLERPPEVQARFMLKRVMFNLVDSLSDDIEPMIPGYEPMFLGNWPPSDNGDRQCA